MKKILFILFFWGLTLQASAATLNDANKLFDWAEESYPAIFSPTGTETLEADNFFCRYYDATKTYYATLGNDVYIYSPMFGNSVIRLGNISDFIQTTETYFRFTNDWLNGKTFYNTYFEDEENKWVIATFTFTETSFSAVSNNNRNDRMDNVPYTITSEGYFTSPDNDDGKEKTNYIKGCELTNDYLSLIWTHEIERLNSSTPDEEFFYFDLQTAQNFVTAKNADIAVNTEMVTIEGKITFLDSDGNIIAVPSDAAVRITSDDDQAKNQYERSFVSPVNSDGTFGITKSVYENSYKEGHTFDVLIFKNHINTDEIECDRNENWYKSLGYNVPYGEWNDIIVLPTDFVDKSVE